MRFWNLSIAASSGGCGEQTSNTTRMASMISFFIMFFVFDLGAKVAKKIIMPTFLA
jgi:hypothetical protein